MVGIVEMIEPSQLSWLNHRYPDYVYDPDAWRGLRQWPPRARVRALVVRNQCQLDRATLAAFPRLELVGRLGTGVDNLDLAALAERHIGVVSAAGINAQAVAESVLMMLLWWSRPWEHWWQETRSGQWPRSLDGHELAHWRVGIVGMGYVGRKLAALLGACGVEVWAFDPHRRLEFPIHACASLDALLAQVHVVTLHCSLRPESWHLLDDRRLHLMAEEAYLINTARGPLIAESDLQRHLNLGRFRGVWLDVREQEPPPTPDSLAGYDRVRLTPHIAGLTWEAQAAVTQSVLEQVVRRLSAPTDPARS